MFKLGTITDGISRDFEYALDTMVETGLEYVELQYLWEKQVGDLTDADIERVKGLIEERNLKVSCISHHNLSALPVDTQLMRLRIVDTLRRYNDVLTLHKHLARIWYGFSVSEKRWCFLGQNLLSPKMLGQHS